MAMVGALIGAPKVLLVNLLVAALLGSAVGIFIKMRYRESVIPYGPFLALGTLASIFFGDAVIDWYRDLLIGV
jgi:leader peptidase (prepilin peptidase)/N-methyltransferase